MMRAILAGGGFGLMLVFAGLLWFLWVGPSSTRQLTRDEAMPGGIATLLGGISSSFFAKQRFSGYPTDRGYG